MTALYAYDGASAFSLTAAKDHGAVLITGYIVGHPGGMDPIDRARVQRIHELGMGFLPNWERGASYLVTASHAQALAAGNEAVAALRALTVPDDGSIACPFSWDVNVAPSQYAHCGAVADGIIEALAGRYRFTAYGQGGLIDYFARTGRLQSEGWLSASSSFPGYDAGSPRVALVQRVGSPVPGTDQDLLTDPRNVHAWWPAGHPLAAVGDALSDLTPAQLDQIASAVWNWDHLAIGDDPKNPTWAPTSALAWVANSIGSVRADVAKIAAVSAVVNDVDKRVAALQSAVAALQPVAQAATDVAAIASAVTDAVVSKLRDLVWGVK